MPGILIVAKGAPFWQARGNMADVEVRKGRILLVYPGGPDLDLYLSALTDAGFETTATASVSAAATLLRTGHAIDLIVMELVPEPDEAWAFIEQRCADVPLIILTSLVRPDRANRKRARALGCAAFVAKPCSLMQLVNVVSLVRRGSRGLEISAYAESRTSRGE